VARRDALSSQLAEAELEVVALTAAAQTAGSQLPLAKRQRKDGPLLQWQTETAHWDLERWNEKEKEEQERRAMHINVSADENARPRTGVDGFLQHWRRGLTGAVQSWARGCKAHVVYMVLMLSDRRETRTPNVLPTPRCARSGIRRLSVRIPPLLWIPPLL